MNAHFAPTPLRWLNRLIASKPTVVPAKPARCKCGRYCKTEKPNITNKLVADMTAAGLYVPPRAVALVERLQGGAQ